jgi:hypothetical protein
VELNTLAHSGDANAVAVRAGVGATSPAEADAIVRDLEQHGFGGLPDTHGAILGFGVAVDVGERFLNDAEQTDFEIAR